MQKEIIDDIVVSFKSLLATLSGFFSQCNAVMECSMYIMLKKQN